MKKSHGLFKCFACRNFLMTKRLKKYTIVYKAYLIGRSYKMIRETRDGMIGAGLVGGACLVGCIFALGLSKAISRASSRMPPVVHEREMYFNGWTGKAIYEVVVTNKGDRPVTNYFSETRN